MEEARLPFTSQMKTWQYIAVLLYLPVHLFGLPLLLSEVCDRGLVSLGMANFWIYAVGAVLMVLLLWDFLRRELDPLFDRPFFSLLEILRDYALIWCLELAAALLLSLIGVEGDAANNQEALRLLQAERGPMIAATVLVAPIVEECLFRAGLFGLLRRKNRVLAYAVSAAAFCLYHVWSYALTDPRELWFILEYLPGAVLLARCYERTNSVWGSILLHAFANGVSLWLILQA